MIKFVHSADIHLGTSFSGIDPRRAEILKKSLARSFDELIDYCVNTDADLLLLSGDIFDSPFPSPSDAEIFRRGIERLGKTPVFAALGNHDYGAAEAMASEKVHVFSTIPEKIFLPELNINIFGQSFSGQNQPESMMDNLTAEDGKINLLCVHGNLGGCGCNPISPKQLEESGFDYIALGHLHTFTHEKYGFSTVCYSGCLIGRGFDETGEKGFISGKIGSEVKVKFVPSSAPRFEEIRVYSGDYGSDNEMLRDIESKVGPNNLCRIIISGGSLPESYIASRLENKAFFVDVRREDPPLCDSPFLEILKEELDGNPRALDIALKALTGRGGEI